MVQHSPQAQRIQPAIPLTKAKIAIVGEAPGATEEEQGFPFLGASGQELTRMLHDAGIIRSDCYLTNVFMSRPPNNDLTKWCVNKKEANLLWREWKQTYDVRGASAAYPHKPLSAAKYLRPEWFFERERLYVELRELQPNVIIALGNTATWALLDDTGVKKHRGTVMTSSYVPGKIISTYHPAAVLRNWSLRAVCIADMMKANYESDFAEAIFPDAEVWIEPSVQDIKDFMYCYLAVAKEISVDIETDGHGIMTCIGFGDCAGTAICIPLVDKRAPGYNYWLDCNDEATVWKLLQAILHMPQPKVLQNGLYDVQYIWKHGMTVRNFSCDTMLKHHSQQPELEKGLGFLGSIYTNYPSWKHIRAQVKTEKADG